MGGRVREKKTREQEREKEGLRVSERRECGTVHYAVVVPFPSHHIKSTFRPERMLVSIKHFK